MAVCRALQPMFCRGARASCVANHILLGSSAPAIPVSARSFSDGNAYGREGYAGLTSALSRQQQQPWLAPMHATTILSVRRRGTVVVIGDGQVTRGSEVVKPNAVKVRRIGDGKVISGFAGSTADCLALRERLEAKLEAHPGQLTRACVELAKEWRTEKYLRALEAVMLVVDKDVSLTVTGAGDVMEPVDGIIAIGSGGSYALAAARALLQATDLDAMAIAERAMGIAAEMCVYTNNRFVRDSLEYASADEAAAAVAVSAAASAATSTTADASAASSPPVSPQPDAPVAQSIAHPAAPASA